MAFSLVNPLVVWVQQIIAVKIDNGCLCIISLLLPRGAHLLSLGSHSHPLVKFYGCIRHSSLWEWLRLMSWSITLFSSPHPNLWTLKHKAGLSLCMWNSWWALYCIIMIILHKISLFQIILFRFDIPRWKDFLNLIWLGHIWLLLGKRSILLKGWLGVDIGSLVSRQWPILFFKDKVSQNKVVIWCCRP